MANIVRQEMGLDAAQAAGGWKSREVVEKTYTDAPNMLNKKAVEYVERLIFKKDFNENDPSPNDDSKRPKLKLVKDCG